MFFCVFEYFPQLILSFNAPLLEADGLSRKHTPKTVIEHTSRTAGTALATPRVALCYIPNTFNPYIIQVLVF